MKLNAQQMKSLPSFFKEITDPRREQGRRHRLEIVLSMAAAATLCGMCGYKAISDWIKDLSPLSCQRFGCRVRNKKPIIPSESTIRNVLMRVDPEELDLSLQRWNEEYGSVDESLAIDGKTMCNAIDESGRQIHIMSAVGHQSGQWLHKKKVGTLPVAGSDKEKQTNEIKIAIPLLNGLNIQGKTITADALLTQRKFARWLVEQKNAHYHFTVKGNQKNLFEDISFHFNNISHQCDHATVNDGHGRIETRKIWVTTDLNDYLSFPHVGQVFMIERTVTYQKKWQRISRDCLWE